MSIDSGSVSQSITVQIVDDTGHGVEGLVAATFPPVYYQKAGSAEVSVPLIDLAAIGSAFSAGGVKELTAGGGYYRLDLPDAAFSTETQLRVIGEETDKHLLYPPIDVDLGGDGARSVTVTVNDGTNPIQGARVRFTKGNETYYRDTNSLGVAAFSLDDGTWNVSIRMPYYTFAATTLVVDGTETPTYSMAAVMVPSPPSGHQTSAYGYVMDAHGEVIVGADVLFDIETTPGSGIYDGANPVTGTSDDNGLLTITLIKNSKYKVRYGNVPKYITTGAGDTFAIPTIISAPG
jgi:hypothetical protein